MNCHYLVEPGYSPVPLGIHHSRAGFQGVFPSWADRSKEQYLDQVLHVNYGKSKDQSPPEHQP